MFLGYPDLEYDGNSVLLTICWEINPPIFTGLDRTEVSGLITLITFKFNLQKKNIFRCWPKKTSTKLVLRKVPNRWYSLTTWRRTVRKGGGGSDKIKQWAKSSDQKLIFSVSSPFRYWIRSVWMFSSGNLWLFSTETFSFFLFQLSAQIMTKRGYNFYTVLRNASPFC